MTARLLVDLLAARVQPGALTVREWEAVLSAARAEALGATLAHHLADAADVPPTVARLFADWRAASAVAQRQALWEAEMARRALTPAGVRFVLLKGTAYAAAGLPNAAGRQVGDLDILVAPADLDRAEAALLAAGWEWVKSDPYDDGYYRQHMHELPPLIHAVRDRMIDVHHSILPRTHRARPDMAVMLADAVAAGEGGQHLMLAPADMLCHCAAHCMVDGDLQGGLRNLYDFHRLAHHFARDDEAFWPALIERAQRHQLRAAVERAARLSHHLYGTGVPAALRKTRAGDALFRRRLLSRDEWGREGRWWTAQLFYIRSHLLRMPLPMLLRHLWTKWRKGHHPVR